MNIKQIYEYANGSAKTVLLYLRKEENYNDLVNETSYLPETISKSERYYCWLNNLTEIPKCPVCGKPRLFYKVNKGYFSTCGNKSCKSALISKSNSESYRDWNKIHEKMKATYKAKTGYEHNMQNPEFIKNILHSKDNIKIKKQKKDIITLSDLIIQYKTNNISLRSLISKIKNNILYTNDIVQLTSFLDTYNPDILERLYYIINDLKDIVKCEYCNKKAKWSGRINEGYKTTCCNKDCESKRISNNQKGKNDIMKKRNKVFIEWQNSITNKTIINDKFIKDNIRFNKHISLLTNPYIISYLKNRFTDSTSLLESYQRIILSIEEKPKCPVCGKPVVWIGKQSKLYTKYCSTICSNKIKYHK